MSAEVYSLPERQYSALRGAQSISNVSSVAINMMNKCAKFHKDSPSGKKVKFNLPSAIELSKTADFVYNFV